jgi:hypothetical protein
MTLHFRIPSVIYDNIMSEIFHCLRHIEYARLFGIWLCYHCVIQPFLLLLARGIVQAEQDLQCIIKWTWFRNVVQNTYPPGQSQGVRGGAVWLRHCTTSRKVAGSIPDGVTGIFHWHNSSSHTMAMGLSQPLTAMSTRNISWWVKAADV